MRVKTLAQLRKVIKKEVDPRLEIYRVRSEGGNYYLFNSNDSKLKYWLGRLYSVMICINHWDDQPVEMWIDDARDIMKQVEKEGGKDWELPSLSDKYTFIIPDYNGDIQCTVVDNKNKG